MKFSPTELPDVVLVEYNVFGDPRGFFFDSWRADAFESAGLSALFVQDSCSRSTRGVLRGLHYQIELPQGKLVRATVGEVFDVAVDIRRSSPTFGRWVGVVLSSERKSALWIPPGFAHGFYVLSETAELAYRLTNYYAPQHERVIRWNDPQIGIRWPIHPAAAPTQSVRDAAGLLLANADCY